MKKIFLLSMICWFITQTDLLSGQSTVFHPTFVRTAVYFDVTPPLRDMPLIHPKRVKNGLEEEIPNRIGMKEFNNRATQPFLLPEDPVWQKQDRTYMPSNPTALQNFEGIGNLSGVYPPDTQGDVGPDKYIQVVNINFAIYSKAGALVLGPAAISTVFAGIPSPWNGTNSGDPVVLYDQAANRWMITQFSLPSNNYAELVAISQTPDPTGSWYRYVFQYGNKMPDYPKLGVWPDAYYLSFNQFVNGATWGGVGACALERAKMLTGDPAARMVYFSLGATSDPQSMLPSDWDGTPTPIANEPNYFTYFNDWSSTTQQYLNIWQFHVDWTTTSNSTFSQAYSLVTAPFNSVLCSASSGNCIPQPGTSVKLESLSDRLMYRLQYRNFDSYRSMVTNHTVNVDGNGRAGIRWYELRNTGSGWTIYQQGTWSPDASGRWMGSMAMNANGDIALGYSLSNSSAIYPSIRYTGRHATDPLGQMTMGEQSVIDGSGNQTGSAARWGDYSGMSVDPVDDQTFWFTTEYIKTSGGANWQTRIASFKFNYSPIVTTLPATNVTTSTATLNGTVQASNLTSTVTFEYGTTTSYGTTVNATPSTVTGNSPTAVSANITGLNASTLYHFRVDAVNSDGTANGNDMTFTTSSSGGCKDNFESNNTVGTAKQILPGAPVTALINPTGDLDWFKFSNKSSARNVKVDLYNLPADYDLQLCNSRGTVIASSQNRGTTPESIIYNTKSTTSFTVRVNGYNGAWDPQNCYTLNVTLSNTAFLKEGEIVPVVASDEGPGMVIYPNPVSGKVNIDYTSERTGKVDINIFNTTGQLLITSAPEAMEGRNTFQVDVSSLNKGIYFLELNDNGKKLFGKVMVK
jgi:hypothetical protein